MTSAASPSPASGVESGVESEVAYKTLKSLCGGDLGKKDIALALGKEKPTRYLNEMVKALVEKSLIEMTIPGTPNSPKQKYRLTDKGLSLLKKRQ